MRGPTMAVPGHADGARLVGRLFFFPPPGGEAGASLQRWISSSILSLERMLALLVLLWRG